MLDAGRGVLNEFFRSLHSKSSHDLNRQDGMSGRKCWFQFRETLITHQTSYYARINYIHQNPVHHKVVHAAENYRWSSYQCFEDTNPALLKAITRFKTDRLKIEDDF